MRKNSHPIPPKKDNAFRTTTAHETSEKLAQPVAPLALGAQVKLVAEAQSKVTGEKNWLTEHSIDLSIVMGLIWSIGKIMYFYYPDRTWTIWVKVVDTFIPFVVVILSIIYRIYPYINVFFSKRKK